MEQQIKSFRDLGIKNPEPAFEGDKIQLYKIFGQVITIFKYEIKPSKYTENGNGKCLYIQIGLAGQKRVTFTGSGVLMDILERIPKSEFPFTTIVIKENERYQFT